MTIEPNYLTAEQECVINEFQRVAREVMGEDMSSISVQVYRDSVATFTHAMGQCFLSNNDVDMSTSVNNAIHKLRTEIKSPAEQAQIDYDRAVKAAEEAKAKLEALS